MSRRRRTSPDGSGSCRSDNSERFRSPDRPAAEYLEESRFDAGIFPEPLTALGRRVELRVSVGDTAMPWRD